MKKNRKMKYQKMLFVWRKRLFGSGMLLLLGLLFMPSVYGQLQAKTISLRVNNTSVLDAIKEINRLSGNCISFKTEELLKETKRVSLNLNETELGTAVKTILEGTALTSLQQGNVLLIIPERQTAKNQKTMVLKGIVCDVNNQPLPGVTVRLAGTTVGTATDVKGHFTFPVPMKNGALEFTFVGFKKYVLAFTEKTGSSELKIILEEDVQAMEEVVVTGYGNVSKGNYTGAATTVKGEDVIMPGFNSIDQMLQGVIPGMLVTTTTGQVGATPKIRVRGTSTLLGSQEPVWVVDGVIQRDPLPFDSDDNLDFSVDADDIARLAGNAISWLNPADIESITVLKDASATAIYGSQAANGVIVITTKKASAGKLVVTYSGDLTIGQRPHYGLYDLMNSAENMQLLKEFHEDFNTYGVPNPTPVLYQKLINGIKNKTMTIEEAQVEYEKMAAQNTDWFDILFRNSLSHSHSIGLSGGSELIQNRTSFSFREDKGEAKGNNLTTFTFMSNTTARLWDRVTVNATLKGTFRKTRGFAFGVDPFNYAYNTSRAMPCYNEDGSLFFHEKYGAAYIGSNLSSYYWNYNILNEKRYTGAETSTGTWGGTLDLKWEIIDGLQYQGMVSYSQANTKMSEWAEEQSFYITKERGWEYGKYTPKDDYAQYSMLPQGGYLYTKTMDVVTVTSRNSLVYDKLFGEKHRITAQVGIETNSVKTDGRSMGRWGYMPDRGQTFVRPPDKYEDSFSQAGFWVNYNSSKLYGSSSITDLLNNSVSEYGSLVYTYDNRYVLNMSARVDASNRFGQFKNRRFEPTWSAGLKWRAKEEKPFRNLEWLNMFDVYGSYGYQGNAVANIAPSLIGTSSYITNWSTYGFKISRLPNDDLGWEKTKTWNLGIDAAFLDGRLNFNFNYFKKNSDVLGSKAVPHENGLTSAVFPGVTMENKGYDIVVNVVPIRTKDFTWQLSVNTGKTVNKVDDSAVTNKDPYKYLSGSITVDGQPFGTFYSYKFAELDPKNGYPVFDFEKENAEERELYADPTEYLVKSGCFVPDFSGGLSMQFKYKGWTLGALFAMQFGGENRLPDLLPDTDNNQGMPGPEWNLTRKYLNRWRKPGDEANTNIPAFFNSNFWQVMLPDTELGKNRSSERHESYELSDIRTASSDFIRCRSISLGYEWKEGFIQRMGVDRMSIKASMANPFMWVRDSKWEGIDPETGNWPARRMSSLSLQLMF